MEPESVGESSLHELLMMEADSTPVTTLASQPETSEQKRSAMDTQMMTERANPKKNVRINSFANGRPGGTSDTEFVGMGRTLEQITEAKQRLDRKQHDEQMQELERLQKQMG